ncbi:MAG: hypothetical protein POELPBGB_02553 [Bacteroidia bacterium]|nr:hypothetical protein [Bacteroidia bacterium]
MSVTKPKLLFIYKTPSSFVLKDRELLARNFKVISFSFNPTKKFLTPLELLKEFIFLLVHIWKSKAIVCEFADYHTVLPTLFGKLTGKPCYLILCGTECYSFPSINYGNHNKKLMSMATCFSISNATHVMPVHKSMVLSNYTYSDSDYLQQGYKAFCKNVETPFTEINYGYDSTKFFKSKKSNPDSYRDKNSFLTVAVNAKGSTFFRKGIDLIIELAKHCPDYNFTLLGVKDELNHLQLPENITLLPPVPHTELINYYSRHEFYLQLSIAEGFPNALCEAMLCECIPIGSDVFGIPDIIGDTGFILKKKDVAQLKNLVAEAVKSDKITLAKKARQRIIENFPEEKREEKFMSVIN